MLIIRFHYWILVLQEGIVTVEYFYANEIGKRLQNGTLSIPPPRSIEHDGQNLSFVLVGDEAFPLTRYMMRLLRPVDSTILFFQKRVSSSP